MNKKYFNILFTLLVFFFLIKKTHGCHPSGNKCSGDDVMKCGAKVVNATWLQYYQLELTVIGPDNQPVHAVGHYSFDDGTGHKYRFLKDPKFVNDHHCENNGAGEAAPFKYVWPYDPNEQPIKGAVGIWITIYWHCNARATLGTAIYCVSEDVYFQSTNS